MNGGELLRRPPSRRSALSPPYFIPTCRLCDVESRRSISLSIATAAMTHKRGGYQGLSAPGHSQICVSLIPPSNYPRPRWWCGVVWGCGGGKRNWRNRPGWCHRCKTVPLGWKPSRLTRPLPFHPQLTISTLSTIARRYELPL